MVVINIYNSLIHNFLFLAILTFDIRSDFSQIIQG